METYVINYNDGRAMTLELTDDQYSIFCVGFQENLSGVLIPDVGCLSLTDVRSIIKQKPVTEQENPSYSAEMTQEEKDYIAQQEKAEQYLKDMAQAYEDETLYDDADFDGSDI